MVTWLDEAFRKAKDMTRELRQHEELLREHGHSATYCDVVRRVLPELVNTLQVLTTSIADGLRALSGEAGGGGLAGQLEALMDVLLGGGVHVLVMLTLDCWHGTCSSSCGLLGWSTTCVLSAL
jgi:hypothetical protein